MEATRPAPHPTKARPTSTAKYLVISPVKDEEPYVTRTLESMIRQTVKPVRWIIVDDGSNDRTCEILDRYEREHDFIRVIKRPRGEPRGPGPAVVRAFNEGYAAAKGLDYDFVVKLDCDLSFGQDYFERIFERFAEDPRLGIASGVYFESPDGNQWNEIMMPSYHTAGPSKIIRRACFEAIGGFVTARGWDTVDELRAMKRGWSTGHFRDQKINHWKHEGSGIGSLRTNVMHGEVYYNTGGGGLFFLFKALHRVTCRPYFIGAAALVWGYLRSVLSRRERLVTPGEARLYRRLLNERIKNALTDVRNLRNF